jgi:Putative metallopeptidase
VVAHVSIPAPWFETRFFEALLTMRKALVLACAMSAVAASIAEAADARADRIDIRYIPPSEPQLQPIADYVKQARALEKVQALLKRLKLPRRLLIEMPGCKGESNAWYDENVVTICYEFMDDIWKNVPQETTASGLAPIVLGNAYQYKADIELHKLPLSLKHFADEHGAPAQRFFNVLCWSYGSDRRLFSEVVSKGYLPSERVVRRRVSADALCLRHTD